MNVQFVTLKKIMVFVVVLAGSNGVKASGLCECDPLLSADNLEQCDAYEKKREAECKTTCGSTDDSGLLPCLEHVMNRTLDIRLLTLKKTDEKEFHKEMKGQASFKSGVEAIVNEFECDGSDCRFYCYPSLREAFIRFRTKQARLINESKLEKFRKPPAKGTAGYSALFKDFAQTTCEMPPGIWAAQTVAKECVAQVLSEIGEVVSPFIKTSKGKRDMCAQLRPKSK